jgi:hypothetical protein
MPPPPGGVANFGVVTGSLPPGFRIGMVSLIDTITILGSCSFPGVYNSTIFVSGDADPDYYYYYDLQITINTPSSLDFGIIPPIKINIPYYHVLRVNSSKDQSNFTISLIGSLPTGIVFNPTVGSPTLIGETTESGTFNVQFLITDNETGCSSLYDYAFIVSSLYLDTVLPCTKPGLPYSMFLTPKGGVFPYRFHMRTNYVLPNDLMLNTSSGLLRGSVYEEGIYVIGVRIFDKRNDFIDHDLTLICSKECLPTTFDWLPSAQSKPVVVGESFMEKNLKRFLPNIFEV